MFEDPDRPRSQKGSIILPERQPYQRDKTLTVDECLLALETVTDIRQSLENDGGRAQIQPSDNNIKGLTLAAFIIKSRLTLK